jgi:hypothetical protein
MATNTQTEAGTQTDDQTTPRELIDTVAELEVMVDDIDPEELSDGELADVLGILKDAENMAEDARKGDAKDELESRVTEGEEVQGHYATVTLTEGYRKKLAEDEDEVLGELVKRGISPQEVMSLSPSTVVNVMDERELDGVWSLIRKDKYTYFR